MRDLLEKAKEEEREKWRKWMEAQGMQTNEKGEKIDKDGKVIEVIKSTEMSNVGEEAKAMRLKDGEKIVGGDLEEKKDGESDSQKSTDSEGAVTKFGSTTLDKEGKLIPLSETTTSIDLDHFNENQASSPDDDNMMKTNSNLFHVKEVEVPAPTPAEPDRKIIKRTYKEIVQDQDLLASCSLHDTRPNVEIKNARVIAGAILAKEDPV